MIRVVFIEATLGEGVLMQDIARLAVPKSIWTLEFARELPARLV